MVRAMAVASRSDKRGFWGSSWALPALVALVVVIVVTLARCPWMRPQAEDFTLPVINTAGTQSGTVRLADQRGKVVLIDFFATWCGPCRKSTPTLVRLHHKYAARGLVVWGIDEDEDPAYVVPSYMNAYDIPYPILPDVRNVARKYDVRGYPTLFLIDQQGRVRFVHSGLIDEEEMVSQIEKLL
jgi:thiol-disulfide isomerase/thioredoxin